MKQIKIVFWIIIIIFLGALFFQNQDFFLAKQSFNINSYIADEYHTPELPVIILFSASFIIGFLIAYLITLLEHFKLKKTIKNLNCSIDSHQGAILELKSEIESLQESMDHELKENNNDSSDITYREDTP